MSRRTSPLVAFAALLLCATPGPARARGHTEVDDPVYRQGLQWSLDRTHAPAAWPKASGRGMTIAIVDSGVDLRHEDLRDKVVDDVSCIGANGDPAACTGSGRDDDGHGTHVAGIAAATTDNERGIAGVAPDASILAVRVLEHACAEDEDCTASGAAGDVSAGIRWAADHGADVINLSLGTTSPTLFGTPFAEAIRYAWQKGAVPVIAAGNDFVLGEGFATQNAIVVTATTRRDELAAYADGVGQAQWGVAAPGGQEGDDAETCASGGTPRGVLSTYWMEGDTNQYACLAGTSMAAPHVSGAVALLRSAGFSPRAAVDRILSSARDLGPKGKDQTFGWGLVDLRAATADLPGPTPTSAPTSTTTTRAQPSSTSTAASSSTSSTEPADESPPPDSTTSTSSDDAAGQPGGALVAVAIAAAASAATAALLVGRRLR